MIELALFFLAFTDVAIGHGPLITIREPGVWRSNVRDCDGEEIISCKLVDIDFQQLWDEDTVEFFPGKSLTKTLSIPQDDPSLESGQFTNDDNDYAVLVYSTKESGLEKLTGVFETRNKSFLIENCGPDCHVLVEEDPTILKENPEPPSERGLLLEDKEPIVRSYNSFKANYDRETIYTYSIMFYYTPGFAAITTDIKGFVDLIISETNAGYMNSQIPLRAKIHCITNSSVTDNSIGYANLRRFATHKGSTTATKNSADAAMLLTSRIPGSRYCGYAYVDVVRPGRSGNAFSLVDKNCATGVFIPGHELGHNFGCDHDRQHSSSNQNYPYEYGYYIGQPTRTGFRTIMTYHKNGWNRVVNHYSSDTVKYAGYATGDALNDCSRVIMENRAYMAGLGNEENACPGKDWELICKQDSRNDTYFTYGQPLPTDDPSADLYCDVNKLKRNEDGKFHLKLCYPLLDDKPCYEWKQTSHPTEKLSTAKGFELISGPDVQSEQFDGLSQFVKRYCIMYGRRFFFCIGSYRPARRPNTTGIRAIWDPPRRRDLTKLATLHSMQ